MNVAEYLIKISASGDRAAASKVESVQNALDAADRSASRFTSRTSGLGSALRALPGAEFFLNPIIAITSGVGVVSKLGMQAEKTTTAFNVLVGAEDKAAKMLGEINSYADNTLWDRTTTQEATKTMLGFGVSTESVVGDLKMLGDVAMGDKNRLQQLALVFGQISAAGKLQGQDLLQLINAGYNPLLDISALTGKSVAQLKDEMSKGLITFDMVRAAFQRATGEGGKFANMTDKIAQTSYGAFEQLKGKFLGALLQIYEIIQPYLIPAITLLGKGLDLVARAAKWVADNMKTVLAVVTPLAAAIVAYNVVTGAATAVTNVFVGVLKLLNIVLNLNPVGLIVAGIAALTAAVVVCWNKFAGFRAVILTAWDTLKGFGQIIKDYVLDRIQSLLSSVGKLGEALGKLFKGDFSGAWNAAKSAYGLMVGADAKRNAAASARELAGSLDYTYANRLASERAKQRAKETISSPSAAGGVAGAAGTAGAGGATAGGSGSGGGNVAKDIATGGTRNTSIVINVSKFFDDVNITTVSGQDMRQLQAAVLESINRSLEIANSAAR